MKRIEAMRAYLHKIVHVILAHRQLRCCVSLCTHFIYDHPKGMHTRDGHTDEAGRFGALGQPPVQHCARGDARAANESRMSFGECRKKVSPTMRLHATKRIQTTTEK